ncbi:MAG: Holliday junction DNA helicase RuvA [Candidatus Taylorbacteria bacterium RIFCSPHIGHO2_02_49_25]|uniref:Holliday junction branch migration complex subunit RuvA n=1 Tax=Candidatus Taylorbacteria bacterium RIFCSPHIGHO2_02_49_25 TaxID=1802305 RepID=A0A1G2MGU0_9BACT|nr:MAG: Holliday junction ATP-dependent DNA helicase RuvA [Parcubacteria group bacterium GW2011_GWF2_50_9]OHA20716.1 MAG: Holliday junction DNA helicase RuvA [Candidatus Taylorbacteria bacterium RIFCSPHIGHO2_01_FULL_49_60]OHA23043.1 MAG: Holliday junction DNA helicase RuvA [Candidatus Taylorbacteria bacterium RIFCSPHIGHO2_02_49_25]OHA35296.1 MAG: Holliday junction DNA helicase RuvA [Candidatus Taylorbacteria bacterium RIFCSPLOWO2_01_FULL_50_130]OHA36380.1 MAG: Holliday junction DNA helicase Ruv
MISYISGAVIEKSARFVVVDAGGIGYRVFVTDDTLQLLKAGTTVTLKTHHVVREDAEELFGFLEEEDLKLFELLLGVPGIGPKTALNILNVATPETLRRSIMSGETAYLTKISGIGRKTAEKIMVELKDKLGRGEEGETLQEEVDVLEALKSLGYSHVEAREALHAVPKEIFGTSGKVKHALKILGK